MQTHAVQLCRYLHERGYHAEVATYRGPEVEFPFPVHRCLSRIGFTENLRTLESLTRTVRPDLLYASTIFYGRLSASTGIPMIARSAGNDVLRPWIVWPYRRFSRFLSTPSIEDILYRRFRKLDWPELIESLMLNRRKAEMAQSARQITRILANSDYTAGLLRELSVTNVDILPGGVDTRRFHPLRDTRDELGLPHDKHLLMTACRMVPKKGLDLLMRAVAKLPDTHLLIAGEGRQLPKCSALAEQLGITGRVTFAGCIPHEDLQRYYWAADQFVLASREHVDPRTGLRDVETMGRVLCEAHAAGVPVIASRSGGIPSIVDHGRNGLLFEENDLDGLIHSIERLHGDRNLSRYLVNEGFNDAAEKWDWAVICRSHERIFRAACVSGPRDASSLFVTGSAFNITADAGCLSPGE
ncbi:MAG: glycosyltransferase family 4 protein [Acidobacteriia bacterium]|nr:glycosyltransferase family 4 protein [Terriglobia bacterium]